MIIFRSVAIAANVYKFAMYHKFTALKEPCGRRHFSFLSARKSEKGFDRSWKKDILVPWSVKQVVDKYSSDNERTNHIVVSGNNCSPSDSDSSMHEARKHDEAQVHRRKVRDDHVVVRTYC